MLFTRTYPLVCFNETATTQYVAPPPPARARAPGSFQAWVNNIAPFEASRHALTLAHSLPDEQGVGLQQDGRFLSAFPMFVPSLSW